jgi:hypothetical protein
MQHLVAIEQIKERAEAVNLNLKVLAHRAGVHPSTAYRGAKRIVTGARLTDALVAEEIRLRDHLLKIHPLPSSETGHDA